MAGDQGLSGAGHPNAPSGTRSATALLTSYMEQVAPPPGPPLRPPLPDATVGSELLAVESYLRLYTEVGAPHRWDGHLRLSPEALSAVLRDPATVVFVLRRAARPVGLCAFLGVGTGDVELKYFGLVPDAQGVALGPYLLDAALRSVWAERPARVWLHTDTNDHPKAKATYERSGFRTTAAVWQEPEG